MSNQPCSTLVPETTNTSALDKDFHGASIISENGNETPITENMIQEACNQLIEAWDTQRD